MTAREYAEQAAAGLTLGAEFEEVMAHALTAIALALTNHPGLAEEEE